MKRSVFDPDMAERELSVSKSRTPMRVFLLLLCCAVIVSLVILVPPLLRTPSMALPKEPDAESITDLSETDILSDGDALSESDSAGFVEDDVFSADKLGDDVRGTGVLLKDAAVTEKAKSGKTLATLHKDEMVLIYDVEGKYYLVSDAAGTVKGYVKKSLVDTFGIEIVGTAKVTEKTTSTTKKTEKTENGTTAKTTVKSSSVSPENFPVNSSPYFILVEKGSHTITIYAKDERGKYTREIRTYLTATGRTSTLTPVGLFSVGAKEKWHKWGSTSYSPYCSRYHGGLFFHGPIYKSQNFGTLKENSVSQIGTNASSGCMRTSAQAAYFIYKFCPTGTYVKIVSGSPLKHGASKPGIASQYIDPATGDVPVAGVSLSPAAVTLKVGSTKTLTAVIEPDIASEKACTWLSDNTAVATVSSKGVVTAKKAGTATIKVTTVDGKFTATCTVTVTTTDPTSSSSTSSSSSSSSSSSKSSESSSSSESTSQSTESTSKSTESTTEKTTESTTEKTTEKTAESKPEDEKPSGDGTQE